MVLGDLDRKSESSYPITIRLFEKTFIISYHGFGRKTSSVIKLTTKAVKKRIHIVSNMKIDASKTLKILKYTRGQNRIKLTIRQKSKLIDSVKI